MDARRLHAKALVCRQSLARKLEQDSFEDGSRHDLLSVASFFCVIPKPRAFTSGARDLASSINDVATREILRSARKPATLRMTPLQRTEEAIKKAPRRAPVNYSPFGSVGLVTATVSPT